jgi:two-component system response regulator MprA
MSTRPADTSRYVLVVEDDPDLRVIEAEVLRMEGYDVRTAADGLDALEVIDQAGAPGLVLLDLRMPRLNGWDLAQRLGARDETRDVPVVVVAAHFATADEAAALGARAWLHKPASIDELIAVVGRIYGRRNQAAAQ